MDPTEEEIPLQNRRRLSVIHELHPTDEVDRGDPLPVRYRKRKISAGSGINEQIRHSVVALKDAFFPEHRETVLSDTSTFFEARHDPFGFLTIRVLFFDILLSVLDTISDFTQGVVLFSNSEKRVYGIVTLAINWIPGFPAAIHLISMYRTELPWVSTILYAGLLIVFYPVVPLLAFLSLLWVRPKSGTSQEEATYREAEHRFETYTGVNPNPKMWLVLNGVVLLDFSEDKSVSITDLQGNTLIMPFTASFCIILSVLALVKASLEVNIIRVHIDGIFRWTHSLQYLLITLDHMPVILTGVLFRISSLIVITTYLNLFGILPIGVFWTVNFVYIRFTVAGRTKKIPQWLISFAALFIPVSLTTSTLAKEKSRLKMKNIQYKMIFWQGVFSMMTYGLTLIAIVVLTNNPSYDFKYNQDIVLNNSVFNLTLGMVLAVGVINLLFSSCKFRESCAKTDDKHPRSVDDVNEADGVRGKRPMVQWCLIFFFLAAALSPVVIFPLLYKFTIQTKHASYLFYKPSTNHTKIVQATTINAFDKVIHGLNKNLLHVGIDQLEDDTLVLKGASAKKVPSDSETRSRFLPSNVIVIISRDLWELRSDQVMSVLNPSAVVIADYERFKPSSPLPNFGTAGLRVPVLLIRMDDLDGLPDDRDIQELWLAPNNQSISDPGWVCHVANGRDCHLPVFDEGNIYGHMYRTKSCTWGGRGCLGYANHQEYENFCNVSQATVCPPDPNQGFGPFRTYQLNVARNLRYNPAYCAFNFNELKLKVLECDSGTSQWSLWLDWHIEDQNQDLVKRSRRRYCFIRHDDCLLEEREFNECCDSTGMAGDDDPFRQMCSNDPKFQKC